MTVSVSGPKYSVPVIQNGVVETGQKQLKVVIAIIGEVKGKTSSKVDAFC